jgi:hypothetical protein
MAQYFQAWIKKRVAASAHLVVTLAVPEADIHTGMHSGEIAPSPSTGTGLS